MNTTGTSNPLAAPGAPTVGLELPPGLPEQLKSHRIVVEGRQEVVDVGVDARYAGFSRKRMQTGLGTATG
jgi:hypothetical protein